MRNSGFFGKGGRVIYQSSFPLISPLDDFTPELMFIQAHTKASEWSYEGEYRLSTFYPTAISLEERVVTVPNEFMKEVIIGVATLDEHKQQIAEAAQRNGLLVYEAYKVPFEFRIERRLWQSA